MKSDLLKEFSVFELRELHCKVFKFWINTEKKMEQLKKQEINSYKESVERDFEVKLLFQKGVELHKQLINIDNELQLRIWEGKTD